MEPMYERPCINVKVDRGSTLRFTRDLLYIPCQEMFLSRRVFHKLPLFYLRASNSHAYTRKNKVTAELPLVLMFEIG